MEAEGEHAPAAEQPLAEVAESEQPAAEEPAATSKTNLKSSANIAPTSSAKPSTTNLAKSAGVSTQSIKNKDSTKSATPSAKASAQNIKASSHTRVASKQTLPTGSKKGSRSDLSPTHGSLKSVRLAPPVQQPEQSSAPSANTIVYENTYKMKPNKKFQSEAVKRLVDDILTKTLKPLQYDPATVPELVKSISNDILQEVKKMEFERYKLIVDVTIGEFKGQGIRLASRCVWDTSTDSYSSSSFRNSSLFAVAIVFGGYQE